MLFWSIVIAVHLVVLTCGVPFIQYRAKKDLMTRLRSTPYGSAYTVDLQMPEWIYDLYLKLPYEQRQYIGGLHSVATGRDTDLSTAELDFILRHETLTSLHLANRELELSEKQLRRIAELPKLRRIYIASSSLTDDAVAILATSDSLESVGLAGEKLTDASVTHLSNSPKIEALSIYAAKVTDEALADVARMPLKRLNLAGTSVTDAGIAHLAGSRSLIELQLHGTQLTDQAIRHLAAIPNLKEVSLGRTRITASGFSELRCLESLTKVNLSGQDNIGPDAEARLAKRIPGLLIERWGRAYDPLASAPGQ